MKRALLLGALAAGLLPAADEVPAWAREAAARTAGSYPAKTPAVVLLQEETLTVDSEGRRVMTERAAIRRLSSGRVDLRASRAYNVKTGRIREIRGWVLGPGGKETRYGKERVLEAAADSGNLYDEAKVKYLTAGDEWQPGTVFAYEIVEEERTVFTQYTYGFQTQMPVLESRFALTLPPGWETAARVLNHTGDGGYTQTGATHTWTLKDLPWIEEEMHSPDWHAVIPRLVLNYFPAGGDSGALRRLGDWKAVSQWVASLSDRQAELTPSLQAKAAQLTAGLGTPLEKIRAIGAFVQKTSYISVQMNLTRGGGYTPHRADDVLTKNYGDCKDKANLMKALLAAAGVESHLVAIYSGSRDFVRPEWPSTMQFNHMIIAVRVGEEVKLPMVTEHAKLGRLLFFDPTDSHTPVGDLPDDEQGSHALVVAGENGALVKVPRQTAFANRVVSETTASMNDDGGIRAASKHQYFGQSGTGLRALFRERDEKAVRRSMERMLTRRLGGLQLETIQPVDNATDGQLDLNLAFAATQFGRVMQGKLLLVAPGGLVASSGYALPATAARKLPVRLEAQARQDKVSITVPAGYQLDELPDTVQLRSGYGEYRAQWKWNAGKVEMEQSLVVNDVEAPAAEYGKVRAFFEQVQGAANAAVVLIKK